MRLTLLVLVLIGCAAESEAPSPVELETAPDVDVVSIGTAPEAEIDVCALAAALASDDICSLICDPPAMAARLEDDGNDRGACYQLYCSLTADEHVLVGVCLPP